MEYAPYIIISGIIGLAFAYWLGRNIKKQDSGNEKMREISRAIHEGAMAFLFREYKILVVFVIIVAGVLGYFISYITAISFVCGAILSTLAGFIGMNIATIANVRTTQAATKSLGQALKIAFSSGAVMGLSVVGFGILGVSILYFIFNDPNLIIGFGFGASSVALFARVGGGIYTKAADVGADLVGKLEAGIPEDDPRNPAVIADNVGDNVGDVAGMGADLFESYVGSILATMIIGLAFTVSSERFVILPLLISGAGIICSVLGTFLVNTKSEKGVYSALSKGLIGASILLIPAIYLIAKFVLPESFPMGGETHSYLDVFYATVAGLVSGVIIGLLTEYYTSYDYKPTQKLSESSVTGAATNIISGLSLGLKSTVLPVLVICATVLIAYSFSGLYGIAIAAVGMLATLGISLAIDAYGPVADNSGGIAEMSKLPHYVRKRTDSLDSVGNTTAAMGKGFAIGSAALTALALFSAYTAAANLSIINLVDPFVIVGLFIGGVLPFLFTALTMSAVGLTAQEMVEEVRRQFKKIKGIMDGTGKPDHKKCVDIATKGALKRMVLPALIAVVAPLIVGYFLGVAALGGLLAGSLVTGMLLAISMANSGGAWDNAKKWIESGKFGGKGSDPHKAAIVGDTVGDPYKDTSAPSLNILIKLMSVVALIFVPLFL
ncbi:sodium-translocating pyrophosphatase [Candidatus Woesearchaeota archaeon]|nr:sodium-translocating pyrophosphatase [Candidatus Woesearchaeota archaeon]